MTEKPTYEELEQRVKELEKEADYRRRAEEEVRAKGEISGTLGRSIDISDRNKVEAKLQQAQKMEALGTLAGGIAHDFNNILAIILGNTELTIEDVSERSPVRHRLEEVRKACLRAKDLVKQILTFSRQTEHEMTPIKTTPIIKESIKLLRSSIPTTIEIRHNLSSHSDTINGDPGQIKEVLINLCSNSADAMRENGGVLEVSLENITLDEQTAVGYDALSPGDYLRLSVSDTGHGIEPDILNRVFDPYFTTKKAGEGTGMGLAAVSGLIRNHNGAITVHSEEGKGATFHVYLPLAQDEISPRADIAGPLPTGSECILFIDDEQSLVNLGRQILGRLGYSVITRTSSSEALDLFRKNPDQFDLVVTDMTMPHMQGDRLAKELIKIDPDIPVILFTGYSDQIDEEKAKEMGIAAYIMKPVAMREMANTIRKVLDKNGTLNPAIRGKPLNP